LDLLTQLQPLNRISLGLRLDLGDDGRQNKADTVSELYLLGMDAFSLGKYAEARACWQEALRLDPKFEPAQEGLDMLNSRQDLQEGLRICSGWISNRTNQTTNAFAASAALAASWL